MRRILLDTHTLIWFLEDNTKMTAETKDLIEDLDTVVYVSIASFWEIAIKKGLSKLDIELTIDQLFDECFKQSFWVLDISKAEVTLIETLPPHHRDPFDRMIVVTGIAKDLDIISADQAFDAYPVRRFW